jgi:hypothetical protein
MTFLAAGVFGNLRHAGMNGLRKSVKTKGKPASYGIYPVFVMFRIKKHKNIFPVAPGLAGGWNGEGCDADDRDAFRRQISGLSLP